MLVFWIKAIHSGENCKVLSRNDHDVSNLQMMNVYKVNRILEYPFFLLLVKHQKLRHKIMISFPKNFSIISFEIHVILWIELSFIHSLYLKTRPPYTSNILLLSNLNMKCAQWKHSPNVEPLLKSWKVKETCAIKYSSVRLEIKVYTLLLL